MLYIQVCTEYVYYFVYTCRSVLCKSIGVCCLCLNLLSSAAADIMENAQNKGIGVYYVQVCMGIVLCIDIVWLMYDYTWILYGCYKTKYENRMALYEHIVCIPYQNYRTCIHTERSFRIIMKSNRNQILFTIFQLNWIHTDVRLDPYQSENSKYNLISS